MRAAHGSDGRSVSPTSDVPYVLLSDEKVLPSWPLAVVGMDGATAVRVSPAVGSLDEGTSGVKNKAGVVMAPRMQWLLLLLDQSVHCLV